MNTEFFKAVDLIEQEKGIPADYMLEKVEAALLSAAKKAFGTSDNAVVVINKDRKDIKLYQMKDIVETVEDEATQISYDELIAKGSKRVKLGGQVKIEVKTKEFGRIAAQTAKQVIIQGIRDAERGLIYQEFNGKESEIISAVVNSVEPSGNAILEIGKSSAMLVKNEQIPGETLVEGDRIKIYVVEVRKTQRGPQVLISRTHPGLVKRLFEREISEIFEGIIEVKSVAREAGSRTKIAVFSKDENIDPVGSCIGARGERVNKIVSILGGEKIDIVKYSDDPAEFIAAALAPAEVLGVEIISESQKACQVTVPDTQLSLAIGNKGQNARLAANLTGWKKIDIRPESGFYQPVIQL